MCVGVPLQFDIYMETITMFLAKIIQLNVLAYIVMATIIRYELDWIYGNRDILCVILSY